MSFLRDVLAALREIFRPGPWPEPPRDETTPQVVADWFEAHRHPDSCRAGCQCDLGKEVN